jgi:hypothetical protein
VTVGVGLSVHRDPSTGEAGARPALSRNRDLWPRPRSDAEEVGTPVAVSAPTNRPSWKADRSDASGNTPGASHRPRGGPTVSPVQSPTPANVPGRADRSSGAAWRSRAVAPVIAVIAVLASLFGMAPHAQAADSFVYWGYWQQTNGSWVYSQVGAAAANPADGTVEGWRWMIDEGGAKPRPPRLTATFAQLCGSTPRPGRRGSVWSSTSVAMLTATARLPRPRPLRPALWCRLRPPGPTCSPAPVGCEPRKASSAPSGATQPAAARSPWRA